MIQTEERMGLRQKPSPEVLYFRVEQMKKKFEAAGDVTNARKAGELLQKLRNNEITAAFCGHFSAGKSSMINMLLGGEVLPSSPIPTSANVVQIKTGKSGARIHLKNGETIEFGAGYNVDELKQYAINGGEVETIELLHPSNLLNIPLSIMDTPGIDSTDDAHKVATESSLHMADIVLYVMDYNHVQSEVNFQFTKTLKDRGKPVFLVINQIDKHVDFELPFSEYRRSVAESFAHWDIHPDGIYFTSLKDPRHAENEWPNLLKKVKELFNARESLIADSVYHASLYLIEEHGRFIREQSDERRESYLEAINHANPHEILYNYHSLVEHLAKIQMPAEQLEEEGKAELQHILDNAPLIPFETREFARLFLESRQPGFKVGFIFSSGKTREEQQKRLNTLYNDLSEKASANLEWHIKEMLRTLPARHGYDDSNFMKEAMDFHVSFSHDLLIDTVKPGAMNNGEYVLNYSKDLAEKVKALFRREALELIEKAAGSLRNKLQAETADGAKQLEEQKQWKESAEQLVRLKEKEDKAVHSLMDLLQHGTAGEEKAAPLQGTHTDVLEVIEEDRRSYVSAAAPDKPVALKRHQTADPSRQFATAMRRDYKGQLIGTAAMLQQASSLISSVPGLSGAGRAMLQRAERLERNRFTVALFGAFSAGKSSFANALMGDLILPVSPNPTTAAINKILPPDENNPHGSVRVRLKNLRDITEDVIHSLAVFGLNGQTVEDAITLVQSLDPASIQPTAKPHYSFLRAVRQGFAETREFLGTELVIGLAEFQEFVAREEKACFVEWIELYYDCPLTRQGIILVDTPGADSINARHTGVAFEYIKNADAVLFVTYYNHAFSHADHEFLIQLGRVKDSFSMDKMFFIVNAADLARSEEELEGVVKHVRDNLEACSIRNPRIYSVSSQTALLARMAAGQTLTESAEKIYRKRLGLTQEAGLPEIDEALRFSGLWHFEEEFISFTVEELTQIAVRSAFDECKRSIGTLDELMARARQDENTRNRQIAEAKQAREYAVQTVEGLDQEVILRSLHNEIHELAYYVKQRVMLRFSEAFRYSFNPATLKSDGSSMQKLLRGSLEELSRFLAFDLAQEMRATALRTENYINKSGQQEQEKLNNKLGIADFSLRPWEKKEYETPDFSSNLPEDSTQELAQPLSLFKNPKQFFEQGGQEKMKDQLDKLYHVPVGQYVELAEKRLHDFYEPAYEKQLNEVKQAVVQEILEHFEGVLAALSMNIDLDKLAQIRQQLNELYLNAEKAYS
ncbi:dynamin family protein [Aneurinibacillus sp. Ricciae_BoGa-3]|uniref:dynamin family protein n=1 Tax=Aneurinibacillus sp. Ricciae_BoGa-3 TaxID=3022697 RepID=UPI0023409BB7|nr:dynamin family protein [Aneurinibacillus sp. Ricciae_BoGa-3]WCK53385.1 dynamin family protein [Aneurinibacillus sp. Ricciae_BoGa-3]